MIKSRGKSSVSSGIPLVADHDRSSEPSSLDPNDNGGSRHIEAKKVNYQKQYEVHSGNSPPIVVSSVSALVAATAEEALSVSGLPLPTISTTSVSLNVSPNHRSYTSEDAKTSLSVESMMAPDGSSRTPLGNISASAAGASVETSSLGNSIFYTENDDDETDGPVAQQGALIIPASKQRQAELLQNKIRRTKEQIKVEQTSLDSNVNEYLKLASNADKYQAHRIKKVFEKKNQDSSQNIAHLQKKLDGYERKYKDLEGVGGVYDGGGVAIIGTGVAGKAPAAQKVREGLKHVGGNIRDMSNSVMSKPKEFANLLMRGGHKFGSVDNLSSVSKSNESGDGAKRISPNHKKEGGSASLPREASSGDRGVSGMTSFEERRKCLSEDGGDVGRRVANNKSNPSVAPPSESDVTSNNSAPAAAAQGKCSIHTSPQRTLSLHRCPPPEESGLPEWKALMQELTLHKQDVDELREDISEIRQEMKRVVDTLTDQLREESDRRIRLEEQLNDLTELHQHEIEHIKNMVNDNEEIAHYQAEERVRDVREQLKMMETKVNSMENQQVHQQHSIHIDNSDARALMVKLLTAAITLIHVLLFFAGICVNLVKPFVRTTSRIILTSLIALGVAISFYQQDVIKNIILQRLNTGDGLPATSNS